MSLRYSHEDLFRSLQALEEATFPKVCRNCGQAYADAAEFLAATRQVRADHSGLKQSLDDDGSAIVEVFRNCVCGSTLLEVFYDRRDQSPNGLKRRQRFGELLDKLVADGVAHDRARAELLKLVRGQPHDLIGLIRATKGGAGD
ncbi:oxidoreductase [Zoogloea sp.]|uniref:oxidoreductase n=1 Tax=Zoogloea sp. TaxID=49181 RepID=UPI0035B3125D